MADVVAVYGQKKITVPAGWTQEQVKAQMARFFPELADPKIETRKTSEKDGDKTEWVFSKKAGTKGAGAATVAAERLARVKESPVAPAWLLRAAMGKPLSGDAAQESTPVIDSLAREVHAVEALGKALAGLPPAWPADTDAGLL